MSKYTTFKFHKEWIDVLSECLSEGLITQEIFDSVIIGLVRFGVDGKFEYKPLSGQDGIIFHFFAHTIERERNQRCKLKEKESRKVSDRECEEYKIWRKAVFLRDNYTCQCCHKKGGQLEAHHLRPYAKFVKDRFDINNGITLCKKCHKKWHKILGNNPKDIFLI